MREIKTKVYRYNELSDSAKETARQSYAAIYGYLHEEEAIASIKALAKHFQGKVVEFEIDFSGGSYSSMEFDMPNLSNIDIQRLLNSLGEYDKDTLKGHGESKLTGVGYDEDAIDGFRMAYHAGKRRMNNLMKAAFRNLLEQCQSEYECFYGNNPEEGDSEFAEHCELNNVEFYEDGSYFKWNV